VSKHVLLPVRQELPDGSYLSEIYPTAKARRSQKEGIVVRVIEYQLQGVEDAEPLYRLVTNLLDPTEAPATELAEQYPQRWELEGSFDEIKTHLREGRKVLRSKLPELVLQEFWGLLLAHHAVRSLMVEAAQKRARDPDEMSFVHAVRVMRRRVGATLPFSP
jgi:IS4 transposase